jgi:hypothetical protein
MAALPNVDGLGSDARAPNASASGNADSARPLISGHALQKLVTVRVDVEIGKEIRLAVAPEPRRTTLIADDAEDDVDCATRSIGRSAS